MDKVCYIVSPFDICFIEPQGWTFSFLISSRVQSSWPGVIYSFMLIMLGQISEKVDVIFCMTENQIFQFSEVWFSGIDLDEEFIKKLKNQQFLGN